MNIRHGNAERFSLASGDAHVRNIGDINDKIRRLFDITEHKNKEILHQSNVFFYECKNGAFEKLKDEYGNYVLNYLEPLDVGKINQFCEFSGNNVVVTDLPLLFDLLEIDVKKQILRMLHPEESTQRGFNFYNNERSICFTCSSCKFLEGTLGYIGVSGDYDIVKEALVILLNMSKFDQLHWGARLYI